MNSRRSFTTLFNLLYIFVRVVWPPFQIYYLKADGAGRTLTVLTILVVLLNLGELRRQKKAFATPAFRCWVVLLLYSMLNSFAKGFYTEFGLLIYFNDNFFYPIILLIVAMLEFQKDKRRCMKAIWIALAVYFIIGLPFMGRNFDERTLVEGLGNLYPLHAVAFLMVSSIMLVEGRIKRGAFIALAFVITMVILMSGTRKAFGAEIIILLGVFLNYGKKKTLGYYFRLIILGIVMLIFLRFSMSHSAVGQRFEEKAEDEIAVQLVGNERVNDILVSLLDDRATQYANGLELFHRHFLTGIGLNNYMYVADSDMRLHTEYMVQLCENGIIGFVLLILFYVFLRNALKKAKKRTGSNVINIVFYGLLVILFLNLTCWTYNQNYVMILYAIILSYANSKAELS